MCSGWQRTATLPLKKLQKKPNPNAPSTCVLVAPGAAPRSSAESVVVRPSGSPGAEGVCEYVLNQVTESTGGSTCGQWAWRRWGAGELRWGGG